MKAAFVVDCSVALTWLFANEATGKTAELLRRLAVETALVPASFYIEVANVIALAERKGRITAADAAVFIQSLHKLGIEQNADAPSRAFTHLLPLCRVHSLTAYDAIYLDLAMREGLPLATLDEPLRKAARKSGVKLLGC